MAKSGLRERVLSALVLIPTVVLLLIKGGWWFFGLVLIMLSAATYEYVRMLRYLGYVPSYVFAIGLVWALLCYFFLAESYMRPTLTLVILASLAWHVLGDRTTTPTENWLLPLGGALYIGWLGGHMLLLRALPQGDRRLLAAFAITWLADSGAYFVGRAWGKHPLAPRLSPKKTWEGFVGGVITGMVSGALLGSLGAMSRIQGALLGLLLSVITPLGDLGVSLIKRQAGLKDTSSLIPGHGGVFDRIDSLLVTAVIGYYYNVLLVGVS